jgi:hypothetical protein
MSTPHLVSRGALYTISGLPFPLLAPTAADVRLADVARGLSRSPRFAGQTRGKYGYSVAQHSVLCSYHAAPADALHALLHDASEGVCLDLPRDLKYAVGMEAYRVIEDRVMTAMAARFGIPAEKSPAVQAVDDLMGSYEGANLVPGFIVPPHHIGKLPRAKLRAWAPQVAERKFLRRFRELTQVRARTSVARHATHAATHDPLATEVA